MRVYPIEPIIDDALKAKYKATIDEYRTEMISRFKATPEQVEKCVQILLKHYSVQDQATREFPFSRDETLKALMQPMVSTTNHPLTNLAHKILTHYKIVDDPHMLTNISGDRANSFGVICQCFYGTVRFSKSNITVFSNWDEGNMCAETEENLAAIIPMPQYLSAMYSRLVEIAQEQGKHGVKSHNPPLKVVLRTPQPESEIPQP